MFQNREEAGKLLAKRLENFSNKREVIILAIPRGGVIVGKQISRDLSLPLSVIVVKKLGAPDNPELAIGAVAPTDVKYIDWDLVLRSGIEQEYLDKELVVKMKEVGEREEKFLKRSNLLRGSTSLKKKIIILVDDGVATGATVFAAIKYIKSFKPTTHNLQPTTILAVPVIVRETFNKLKPEISDIIALEIPDSFNAVGEFYREFPQVTDAEVIRLLK